MSRIAQPPYGTAVLVIVNLTTVVEAPFPSEDYE